jgi:hypothetical protein
MPGGYQQTGALIFELCVNGMLLPIQRKGMVIHRVLLLGFLGNWWYQCHMAFTQVSPDVRA